MNYLELRITVSPSFADILVAELAEIGCDSFLEETDALLAYVPEEAFQKSALDEILDRYQPLIGDIQVEVKPVIQQNWNEEWERNYPPIFIGEDVLVKARFHELDTSGIEYVIEINPKMSFGTGHHETTEMMLLHQLEISHENKTALDVGTGTGILAIMAAKRGASHVAAFDIEEWSAENTVENTILNGVESVVSVRCGTIQTEPHAQYDVVLANINRNILLREIPDYVRFMKPSATLVVSGFYTHDAPEITACATTEGLTLVATHTKNGWAALRFERGLE